ncbi:IS66 family transposase [Burkholderia paludis]|uniref:IS66 family transposase n=2 Tax=Burkholderiaceae TaxID=119060 RepID=UPI003F5BF809
MTGCIATARTSRPGVCAAQVPRPVKDGWPINCPNNKAERAIRPVVPGRQICLFSGSDGEGPKLDGDL